MASGDSVVLGEKGDTEDAPDYHSSKTGPKGVLTDYTLHQAELEEQRERKQKEIKDMMEKQAVNFKEKKQVPLDMDSQQFLEQYRAQKFMELKEQAMLEKKNFFGHLIEIRGDKYAETIDKESPDVFVVISIYEEHCQDSQLVNQCLIQLARTYPTVKFVRVQAHKVQMSDDFIAHGIPAVLVYKGGNLLGNFVKITETLKGGEKDFSTDDMEAFLLEKNCLPSFGRVDFAPPLKELQHHQSGSGN